jgi:hypothetical protein
MADRTGYRIEAAGRGSVGGNEGKQQEREGGGRKEQEGRGTRDAKQGAASQRPDSPDGRRETAIGDKLRGAGWMRTAVRMRRTRREVDGGRSKESCQGSRQDQRQRSLDGRTEIRQGGS